MCCILFVLPDILLFRSVVYPLFFKLHVLVSFYFFTFVPTRSLVVNLERAFPNDIRAAKLVPSRIKLYSYTNEPLTLAIEKWRTRKINTRILFVILAYPILSFCCITFVFETHSGVRFYCIHFVKLHRSFFTWRQGCHFNDTAQRKSGHVGLPNSSFEGWTLFLCNNAL